jgi:hypothetical protein
MLVLGRQRDQVIMIGDNIQIKGGVLEYKCRSCGGCFQPTEVDDAEQVASDPTGSLLSFHLCPSGVIGIADLIGVVLPDRARTLDSLVDKYKPKEHDVSQPNPG